VTVRVVALDDYQGLVEQYSLGGRPDGAEWVAIREHLTGEALVAALDGAAVIVAMRERTRFDRELFARLPDLKLLITTGMQNASIDLQAAAAQGVVVSGTSGPRTTNTAELTWALILALVRHLPEEAASVRDGGWQHTVGTDLLGSTLGLVGLGRIGHQMARIGQAFGMDMIAWSQHLDPAVAAEAGVRAVSKADLFSAADVVSVHLMLSDRTRGLITERDLRAMKPTAYLVNTSRGPIIDAAALLRALNEGWIAGAGLDVYDTEPLPVDDPLRRAPRTVLTPHLGYVTERTMRFWYEDAVEDIAAWQQGKPVHLLTPG
jgi:phosphoglycerate dehydrogenase-like enzyme